MILAVSDYISWAGVIFILCSPLILNFIGNRLEGINRHYRRTGNMYREAGEAREAIRRDWREAEDNLVNEWRRRKGF